MLQEELRSKSSPGRIPELWNEDKRTGFKVRTSGRKRQTLSSRDFAQETRWRPLASSELSVSRSRDSKEDREGRLRLIEVSTAMRRCLAVEIEDFNEKCIETSKEKRARVLRVCDFFFAEDA